MDLGKVGEEWADPGSRPTSIVCMIFPKIEYNHVSFKPSKGLEMAQQLKALTVLAEDPGSIAETTW